MDLSKLITAARAGLESLRVRGLVEPQCLLLQLNGRQLHWSFFKFVALPGHPSPGNASKRMPPTNMSPDKAEDWYAEQRSLYSHPCEVSCVRQSSGYIPAPWSESLSQVDAIAAARNVAELLFGDEILDAEIARYTRPGEMDVTTYELPSGRRVRHGDEDADRFPLSEIVLLRNGRSCWEEYPRVGTVDVQPDFEGMLGLVVDEAERRRIDDETV